MDLSGGTLLELLFSNGEITTSKAYKSASYKQILKRLNSIQNNSNKSVTLIWIIVTCKHHLKKTVEH